MTEENLLDIVTQGDAEAQRIMTEIAEQRPEALTQLIVDLEDMRITGEAVPHAFEICKKDIGAFINAVSGRDWHLVQLLQEEGRSAVRQHGEQKVLPAVDGAIKEILAQGKADYQIPDSEAEHVHNFFVRTVIPELVKRDMPQLPVDGKRLLEIRYYLGQREDDDAKMLCKVLDDYVTLRRAAYFEMKINVNAEPASWAKFYISLLQIEDRDGNKITPETMNNANSEGFSAGGEHAADVRQHDEDADASTGHTGN